MDLIVSKYIWPKITDQPWIWPIEISVLIVATWQGVLDLMENWFSSAYLPIPCTLLNLKSLPGKFLPLMAKISEEFALFAQERCAIGYLAGLNIEDKEDKKIIYKKVPRPFTVFPIPSMKWRHVSINTQAICGLAGISRGDKSYERNMAHFNQCFKLEEYGYTRYYKNNDNSCT